VSDVEIRFCKTRLVALVVQLLVYLPLDPKVSGSYLAKARRWIFKGRQAVVRRSSGQYRIEIRRFGEKANVGVIFHIHMSDIQEDFMSNRK
jgi:hypothetical protein